MSAETELVGLRLRIPPDGGLLVFADGSIRTLTKREVGAKWILTPALDHEDQTEFRRGHHLKAAGYMQSHRGGYVLYMERGEHEYKKHLEGIEALGTDE